MATLDYLKALNSGGLTINSVPARYPSPPPMPAPPGGKVLGASTTAPTVKRYTTSPTQAKTSNQVQPGPPLPALPSPSSMNPISQPPPAYDENYVNPVDEYYKNLDTTAPTGDEQALIREQARKDMQAYIDAINGQYAGLIGQEQQAGQGRLGQTRAINARSGLGGSDFGSANLAETEKYNAENVKALEAEKQVRLQEVNGKIDQRARDEIAAKKAEALGNSEKYIGQLEKNQESARNDLKTIAKSGAKLDDTKRQVLQKQSGYDPLTFESIWSANQPVPEYFSPIETKSGELIVVGKDGSVKNLGKYDLPGDYTLTFQPGSGIPFVYDKNTGEFTAASKYYVPKTPAEKDTRTASEKEYEYAKGQGFNGTFLDYQKEVKQTSREL